MWLASFLLLLGPAAGLAQTAEPQGQTLQALLAEVRELRMAIERSSLLGARIQIAVQRLQVQETRTVRAVQEEDRLRRTLVEMQADQERGAGAVRSFEEQLRRANAGEREQIQQQQERVKSQMEGLATSLRETQARNAEAAVQAQTDQRRLADLQGRIDDLERTLDAAIQQTMRKAP